MTMTDKNENTKVDNVTGQKCFNLIEAALYLLFIIVFIIHDNEDISPSTTVLVADTHTTFAPVTNIGDERKDNDCNYNDKLLEMNIENLHKIDRSRQVSFNGELWKSRVVMEKGILLLSALFAFWSVCTLNRYSNMNEKNKRDSYTTTSTAIITAISANYTGTNPANAEIKLSATEYHNDNKDKRNNDDWPSNNAIDMRFSGRVKKGDTMGIAMASTLAPLLVVLIERKIGGSICGLLIECLGLALAVAFRLELWLGRKSKLLHDNSALLRKTVFLHLCMVSMLILSLVVESSVSTSISFGSQESVPSSHSTLLDTFSLLLPLVSCLFFFTFIQMILLILYDMRTFLPTDTKSKENAERQKNPSTSNESILPVKPTSSPISSSLQRVFTIGEWVTVSSFLSLFFAHYFIQYCFKFWKNNTTNILDHYATPFSSLSPFLYSSSNTTTQFINQSGMHLMVAHSGLVACMIGCCLVNTFTNLFFKMSNDNNKNYITIKDEHITMATTAAKRKKVFVIKCILQTFFVIFIILFMVSVPIQQWCHRTWYYSYCRGEEKVQLVENLKDDYFTIDVNGKPVSRNIQNQCLFSFCRDSSHENNGIHNLLTRAVFWLIHFLSQSEIHRRKLVAEDDLTDLSSSPFKNKFHKLVTRLPQSVPRYIWLFYWVFILVCTFPIAVFIAKKLKCFSNNTKRNNDTSSSTKSTPGVVGKNHIVVIARKFFHFIAFLLFFLPTLCAPQMMSLSYAVATAFLILVESLRVNFCLYHDNISLINKTTRSSATYVEKNEYGSALSINDFYEAFFDEKDKGVGDGNSGFVVTHIALVVGCALPLWINEICQLNYHKFGRHFNNVATEISPSSSLSLLGLRLLPFMGLIVLGVGDSAGAVVGTLFGKRKWPGSSRTIEGSFAMLLSMAVCVVAILYCQSLLLNEDFFSLLPIIYFVCCALIPLTLLEASTSQIDNLCLPLVGSCLVLILL